MTLREWKGSTNMLNPDYMPNSLPAMFDYAQSQDDDMVLPVLVDIAISLRLLSGGYMFSDTPAHRRVRELARKGETLDTSTMRPAERKYYEALQKYYAENPPTWEESKASKTVAEYDRIYHPTSHE